MGIINLLQKSISQQELLNYYNASITFEKLPIEVNGMVFNFEGINNIIINKSLSDYKRKKTILHELAHIELNHLNQMDKDLLVFRIDKCDDEADCYIRLLLEVLKKEI